MSRSRRRQDRNAFVQDGDWDEMPSVELETEKEGEKMPIARDQNRHFSPSQVIKKIRKRTKGVYLDRKGRVYVAMKSSKVSDDLERFTLWLPSHRPAPFAPKRGSSENDHIPYGEDLEFPDPGSRLDLLDYYGDQETTISTITIEEYPERIRRGTRTTSVKCSFR